MPGRTSGSRMLRALTRRGRFTRSSVRQVNASRRNNANLLASSRVNTALRQQPKTSRVSNVKSSSTSTASASAPPPRRMALYSTHASGGGANHHASQASRDAFCLDALSKESGVQLTNAELALLRGKLGPKNATGNGGDAIQTVKDRFLANGQQALERQWAREFCLSVVEQPVTKTDKIGSRLLTVLDFGGKTLFAVVGTQIAGDAEMNVVGAVLVGCISCLGGGTLNCWLYGASPLLSQPGVNWVRNPTIFFMAVTASVLTFYTWPIYCRQQAKQELREVFGKEHLEPNGSVGKAAFVRACQNNSEFQQRVATAVNWEQHVEHERELKRRKSLEGDDHDTNHDADNRNDHMMMTTSEEDASNPDQVTPTAPIDPEKLFDLADTDHSGYIEIDEMQSLVQHRFNHSSTIYMLDSVALSALAVTAVHMAITRGLHPVVAATSGITTCFGGILRDVLCGRHMALGGQSYALATGCGSTVYVLLRQLSLSNNRLHVPLVARILLSAGTTIAVRMLEFWQEKPLLHPMHYHAPHEDRLQERLLSTMAAGGVGVAAAGGASPGTSETRTLVASPTLGSPTLAGTNWTGGLQQQQPTAWRQPDSNNNNNKPWGIMMGTSPLQSMSNSNKNGTPSLVQHNTGSQH